MSLDQIKAPFTDEQVVNLNDYQAKGRFHPFTCKNDGDKPHITYEFEKKHKGENYKQYLKEQKEKGINFPEMEFTATNLVATPQGWICPACNYTQNWAHSFMAEKDLRDIK